MPKDIGKQFMSQTQLRRLEPSDQSRGLPQPPLELPYDAARSYVALPRPDALRMPPADLRSIMEQRRTLRAYAAQPLTLDELSWLLWATQGVQRVISRPSTLRVVPSAGARHAVETLVLANRVAGVAPGLYRFAAGEHKLVERDVSPGIAGRVATAAAEQEFMAEKRGRLHLGGLLARMYWRYGERGDRYLFLDAGHVCQNLYLAAEAIGCGACAVGAFHDDLLSETLGLDREQQFVTYMATVGRRKPSTHAKSNEEAAGRSIPFRAPAFDGPSRPAT